jgi:hypothetical protein
VTDEPIVVGHARDFPPLDFAATLNKLAEWEGREVLVMAHAQAPGFDSHSQVTTRGVLGSVEMVDNAIDREVDSVAAFRVGSGRFDRFYVSAGDFLQGMLLPHLPEQINIAFKHDFHIEVHATV